MKKGILLLAVAIIIVNFRLSANLVAVQNAQAVAVTFYQANAPASGHTSVTAVLKYTKTEPDNTVDFYVFDIAPKGFVIVSADDNMEPVLGYSSESNFDINVAGKKGVGYWMNQTASKIYSGIQQHITADARIGNLWTSYQQGLKPGVTKSGVVTPLLTTTWNQEPYYNQLCPFNTTDNQRAVTGCVACAMAQIMKFWNFPAHGTGSYSYNDATPNFSNNYGTQSANFGTTTYNWTNMPASISANNNDVATLMYHCGVSVAMDYGDDNQGGSGAFVLQAEAGGTNPCAQKSYATYFNYNASTMQGVWPTNYTPAAWVTLLENELSAGRPIQYEGFEPSAGGHTWVCDGFDANNMFHMNWGWGGYDNGYFVITNLNPNPYTFNNNDAALIGIQPVTTTCGVPASLTTTAVTSSSATFNWVAVSGAVSYGIQYRQIGATSWLTGTSATTSFGVTGLTASSNYEWQVKTVCQAGSSAFTASATFTTAAVPACNVPASLTITAVTSSSATFNWAAVSGAISYGIQYRKIGAANWSTGTSTTPSFSVTGLTASSNYEWQVKTVCSAGSSAFTASTTFTTSAAASCNVPGGLLASAITTTSATLGWTAVAGAAHYNIQYRKVGTTTWSTGTATVNSFGVTGLTASSNYEFQVQTVCSSGTSAFSASGTFTTSAAVNCGVPAGLSATTITNTGASLSWTAVTGATRYNVQYKASSASNWTTVSGITTTHYSVTALAGCSTYQFEVQSVCTSGISAFSAAAGFTTTGCVVNYCASASNSSYEYINKVTLGTISNTSGNNGGYGNFTTQSTNLAGGSTATIGLTPGFTGSTYHEYWTVYIDYNHNGVFTDAGEMVYQGNSTGAVTGSFVIPTTALNGSTRMRIQMQYGAYETNPCATYSFGEVEDYSVIITGNLHSVLSGDQEPGLTPEPETSVLQEVKLFPNPAQDVVTIEYSSNTEGSANINIYNLSGQKMMGYEKSTVTGFNSERINTNTLSDGVYIFELENNGDIRRQRFIVSK